MTPEQEYKMANLVSRLIKLEPELARKIAADMVVWSTLIHILSGYPILSDILTFDQ